MKNQIKHLFLVMMALVILVPSCKKDSQAPSKKELLSGKNWKLTAWTTDPAQDWDGNGTMVTNIYAQLPEHFKDDIYHFTVDGKYTFEEGASKAKTTDPQIWETGTWTLSSDESNIATISNSSTQSYKLIELTSTSLKWSQEDENTKTGVKYTYTQAFSIK